MFGYILAIYLIIGIITVIPYLYVGVAEGHSEIAEEDLGDNAVIFGLGLGVLLNVIVWPYWIGYVIYQVHFVND